MQSPSDSNDDHLSRGLSVAIAAPPLTQDQLKLVRTVAEHEALRLDLPEGQAGLLTEAMMGALTASAA